MCDFCEEYRYGTIQKEQNNGSFLTEIGVKMCTYKYRNGNKDCIPSSIIGRIHPLNFCPVCGNKLTSEE